MKTIAFEDDSICAAFQNALEDVMKKNPDAKGVKTYKIFEELWNCKLHYNVEAADGACTGVTIEEEQLTLLLLKHSSKAKLPSLLR